MNTEPVCFGSRSNQYGAFNITKTGLLKTMKLVHKSGSIKCNPNDPASYWGCRYVEYNQNGLLTIITKSNRKAFLPPAGDLKVRNDEGCRNDGNTFTILMGLPTPLQSSFLVIFQIICLCHAIRSCRYGTDRIGPIVVNSTTMEQHVWMCMQRMLNNT